MVTAIKLLDLYSSPTIKSYITVNAYIQSSVVRVVVPIVRLIVDGLQLIYRKDVRD